MNALIILIFIAGYVAIAVEHSIRVNKAAIALITGVLCWTVYFLCASEPQFATDELMYHTGSLSGILFFLLGAMTIVELIDAHDGFQIIIRRITETKKIRLLWIIAFLSFFLSAVLDNLTTTIVMVSLLRKLIRDDRDRLFFTGMVIIAANAGGAWSPIGDVTTTMLWIGGQLTAGNLILKLFIPSLGCVVIPLMISSFRLKGNIEKPLYRETDDKTTLPVSSQRLILFSGLGILLLVPVFKTLTHLPPFMGMMIGLGILWLITEIVHSKNTEEKNPLSVANALQKIDTPSILFFLGILLAIAAMESSGILPQLAVWLNSQIGDERMIVFCMGLISAIVDNVPLVAAAQGMYGLDQYSTDHHFWELLAYCTGTGGSVLVIGSAAGVAAMGMENINFMWYLRHISWLALAGYLGGVLIYMLQQQLIS